MRSAAMSSMAFTLVGRGAAVVAPRGALRLPPRRYSADGKPRANQPAGAVRTGLEPASERLHSLAHAHEPCTGPAHGRAVRACAVVADVDLERAVPCPQCHLNGGAGGVLEGVGQPLLNHPVRHLLELA